MKGADSKKMSQPLLYVLHVPKLEQSFDFLYHDTLLSGTYLFVNLYTVFEKQDGRDVADTVTGCNVVVLIDVQFADNHFVFKFMRQVFHDGTDHFAGAAPFCPEIQQHGHVGFQYIFIECGVAGVDDTLATHCGIASCLGGWVLMDATRIDGGVFSELLDIKTREVTMRGVCGTIQRLYLAMITLEGCR